MKRLAFALTAVAAFTGQALAADMAVKAPPPVVSPISWTGFYLGINGGGAWTDDPSMTYVDLANTGTTFNSYNPTTVKASSSSGLAGFHGGYNWQAAPNWLLGVEGDWDWVDLNASGMNFLTHALVGTVFTDNASLATKVDWLASVRGRAGYVWNNQLLFYATGGVAFADMKFSAAVNCTNVAPSFCGGGAQSI